MLADFLVAFFSFVNAATILVFISVAFATWWYYNSRDLPPGPWSLPLLGYLPYLNKPSPDVVFHNLSKKYGNVMSLMLGMDRVVVLGNYEAIKEAYVKQGENFSGRPLGLVLKTGEQEVGVVASDGDLWREHRRFIMSTLRDYGMGKLSLEPEIMSEIHCFLEELGNYKGQSQDVGPLLGVSTANVIAAMVFGQRFPYSDKRFAKLRHMLDRITDLFTSVGARGFFPNWVRFIPFVKKLTGEEELKILSDKLFEFLIEIVNEHRELHVDDSRKDYIDAYISEQKQLLKKCGDLGYFGQMELIYNLLNVFGAGTETTTSTLRFAFLYMALHPEVQSKVQKEIDDVIGMERAPSLSDRTRMTYTEAVLQEVQRCGSVVPLNLVHSNFEEARLFGYRIPKRTQIISNLWAVHRDPSLWDNPESFMPERFIDNAGKIKKIEHMIPFGIGKRMCLGESLARMELFLYFTSMLQRFTLKTQEGNLPSLEECEFGITRRPKPYKLRLIQRVGYHVA